MLQDLSNFTYFLTVSIDIFLTNFTELCDRYIWSSDPPRFSHLHVATGRETRADYDEGRVSTAAVWGIELVKGRCEACGGFGILLLFNITVVLLVFLCT